MAEHDGFGFTVDYDVIRNSCGEPFRGTIWQVPRQYGKTYVMQWIEAGFNKKEKTMDREEAAKELAVLEAKIKEIKEGLEREDKKPWRAKRGDYYYFVNGSSDCIETNRDNRRWSDNGNYNNGNYFKTKEIAKASLIYKVLNDKWHYWVRGVSIPPDECPDGCQHFDDQWCDENLRPSAWGNLTRRWPKHP